MKRTIGERLKKARKDAKIRQGDAAEKMEMSRPTLSAIEADKRLVWAEEITKFAEMYKVSANELLYGFADELLESRLNDIEVSQDPRLIEYLLLYKQLNEKNQLKVLKTMNEYLKNQKYLTIG